nr:hypothetical protein [Kibdelosporangium sp. MJ126-NF4]CEL16202.1 Octanoate-[acyl-carrier-protein]-protein-N-octanoyltransferase [Kibdelosporangium sp. MJ126-NF4]CTQ94127.1 Octanoate-[acyl-carrier-protein]-protein-N-octanoyltransferase [Kibdelosporangium sp. MJ126-NF4]
MNGLLLACSTVDVTPPVGHPLGGYVARGEKPATATLDPLEATVFWLSTADDPGVLWLSIDALAVDTALARRLAEAVGVAVGIPPDRVLVCASHTHSGPLGWTGSIHPAIPGDRDQALIERLVAAVVAVVADLPAQRVPVDLSWCVASVTGLGSNRNHKDGPHDTSAGVVVARPRGDSATPRTLAVLVDYACHPTVLGPRELAWSADWPGAARRLLAGALAAVDDPHAAEPARPVVAFLQGAAGDSSPRFVRRGRDYAEVARLGALLVGAVLQAVQLTTTPVAPEPPRVYRRSVRIPTRDLSVTTALSHVEQTGREDSPEQRLSQTKQEGVRILTGLRTVDLPADLELPLTVVTLGHIAWVHLPVELFGSFGLRIKEASPFPVTRVIGYTDGYAGYVPDADGLRVGCQEALLGFLDEGAGEILVNGSLQLLEDARHGGGPT